MHDRIERYQEFFKQKKTLYLQKSIFLQMKKTIILFFLFVIPCFLFSQDTEVDRNWGFKGYSGGMFVHTGYIQSKLFTVNDLQNNSIDLRIKNFTFGLGGKISIYLNRYFRIGGEGYFSTCKYRVHPSTIKSSCRIGWGGLTFDILYPVKKWAPFVGVTIGGGSATNLIFTQVKYNNYEAAPVVYFTYPLCIINPTLGIEYFVSNRISLLFKMDYMLNVYQTKLLFLSQNTYPHGVRFYLGIHFYHKK